MPIVGKKYLIFEKVLPIKEYSLVYHGCLRNRGDCEVHVFRDAQNTEISFLGDTYEYILESSPKYQIVLFKVDVLLKTYNDLTNHIERLASERATDQQYVEEVSTKREEVSRVLTSMLIEESSMRARGEVFV